jgi:CMP-N,N'-diacetyllegionaminic acid synthase
VIDGKTVLAIIPARGGSKRLPGKNIRSLMGKPLIAWTIEAAQRSGVIDHAIVSTDDETTAKVAEAWGAKVPWMRPAELATDVASSMDVINHVLDRLQLEGEKYDLTVLLQPTSPFRAPSTVARGVEVCFKNGGKPVVAVSPAENHPSWCFHVVGGVLSPICPNGIGSRSQDLTPAYVINGSLYVSSVDYLRVHKTFFETDTTALIIEDKKEALDIDDEWDWMLAEILCHSNKRI